MLYRIFIIAAAVSFSFHPAGGAEESPYAAYRRFVDETGIDFRYILDDQGTEEEPWLHPDFPAFVEELRNYPDEMLYFLGHSDPPMVVNIYHREVENFPCEGRTNACAPRRPGNTIEIRYPDAVVHETAHIIHSKCFKYNTGDDGNPLRGLEDYFWRLFSIPREFWYVEGENYEEFERQEPPPGYLDWYSLVDEYENFAVACENYVKNPDNFLAVGYRDARGSGTVRLLKQYRFIHDHVFAGRSFTELVPPQDAVITVWVQDGGDNDGRVEPGEDFYLLGRVIPLSDKSESGRIVCEPYPESSGPVRGILTRSAVDYLDSGREYPFYFHFRSDGTLPPDFPFLFSLYYQETGDEHNRAGWTHLGDDWVSLNERGYLWTWVDYDEYGFPALARFTSLLEPKEFFDFPNSLEDRLWDGNYRPIIDPVHRRCLLYPVELYLGESFLYLLQLDGAGAYQEVLLDYPEGITDEEYDGLSDFFDGRELEQMLFNPCEDIIWFLSQGGSLGRGAIKPGPESGRLEVRKIASPFPVRYLALDRSRGKVWAASFSGEVARFSRSGERVEVQTEISAGGRVLALEPDGRGGCWVALSGGVIRINPDGSAAPFHPVPIMDAHRIFELTLSVLGEDTLSLWAKVATSMPDRYRLLHVRVSPTGYGLSDLGRLGPLLPRPRDLIASTADESIFPSFETTIFGEYLLRPERHYPDGTTLAAADLPPKYEWDASIFRDNGYGGFCYISPEDHPVCPSFDYAAVPYRTGFEQGLDIFWEEESEEGGRVKVVSGRELSHTGSRYLSIDHDGSGSSSIPPIAESRLKIDLRAGLENAETVFLSFWWETTGRLGTNEVYLSTDGGDTFVRIDQLTGPGTSVFVTDGPGWERCLIDLVEAAEKNGLLLTEECVVSFRHRSFRSWLKGEPSSLRLDDVAVYPWPYLSGGYQYDTGITKPELLGVDNKVNPLPDGKVPVEVPKTWPIKYRAPVEMENRLPGLK